MNINLNDYNGKYIPDPAAAEFFLEGKSAVERHTGQIVTQVIETHHNTWFITDNGYTISSNGYCFKSKSIK